MNYTAGVDDHIAGYNDFNLGVRYNINKQLPDFCKLTMSWAKHMKFIIMYPVQQLPIWAGAVYQDLMVPGKKVVIFEEYSWTPFG